MAHFVETPDGPAQTVTPSEGVARRRLSVPVRLAQIFYAGMGAFGAGWSWHLAFVRHEDMMTMANFEVV